MDYNKQHTPLKQKFDTFRPTPSAEVWSKINVARPKNSFFLRLFTITTVIIVIGSLLTWFLLPSSPTSKATKEISTLTTAVNVTTTEQTPALLDTNRQQQAATRSNQDHIIPSQPEVTPTPTEINIHAKTVEKQPEIVQLETPSTSNSAKQTEDDISPQEKTQSLTSPIAQEVVEQEEDKGVVTSPDTTQTEIPAHTTQHEIAEIEEDSKSIIYDTLPSINNICLGEETILEAPRGNYHQWSNGEMGSSIVVKPEEDQFYSVTYEQNTQKYHTTIKVNTGGCAIFIPNAFTPNSDGLNDFFRPKSEGITELELIIFSRWGNVVHQSKGETKGWDGTSEGKKMPTGVYLYSVTYKDCLNNAHKQYGTVTLLR